MSRFFSPVLLIYLFVVTGTVLTVTTARRWTIATYATHAAAEDWQEWRERARKMADDDGPVRRRPPPDQPPALILMRDYFRTCMVIALVFATLLYFVAVVLVRGVFVVSLLPMEDARKSSR